MKDLFCDEKIEKGNFNRDVAAACEGHYFEALLDEGQVRRLFKDRRGQLIDEQTGQVRTDVIGWRAG